MNFFRVNVGSHDILSVPLIWETDKSYQRELEKYPKKTKAQSLLKYKSHPYFIDPAELVVFDKPDQMFELQGLLTLFTLEFVLSQDHAVLGWGSLDIIMCITIGCGVQA